jgi:hypothetical protein
VVLILDVFEGLAGRFGRLEHRCWLLGIGGGVGSGDADVTETGDCVSTAGDVWLLELVSVSGVGSVESTALTWGERLDEAVSTCRGEAVDSPSNLGNFFEGAPRFASPTLVIGGR